MKTKHNFLSYCLLLWTMVFFTACEEQINDSVPPQDISLYSVQYSGGAYIFTWSKNRDVDFKSYKLYESANFDMTDYELIYETEEQMDTSFVFTDPIPGVTTYFQLVVDDRSNNATRSQVRPGYGQKTFYAQYGTHLVEFGVSVVATPDSGYAILGTVNNNIDFDMMLVKTNSDGVEEWTKYYGGTGFDIATALAMTSDNGFVISGHTTSNSVGRVDAVLLRTDNNGNELWKKTFGGSGKDQFNGMVVEPGQGFILCGQTQYDQTSDSQAWLVKTDASGNEVWSKTYGDTLYDVFNGLTKISTGEIIGIGTTRSQTNNDLDILLMKLSATGELIWEKTLGGSDSDYGYGVIETLNGDIAITGTRNSDSGINTNDDVYFAKISQSGERLYHNWYGNTGYDEGIDILQDEDGAFVIAGYTTSYGFGSFDILLLKLTENGNEVWTRSFGGEEMDRGFSVSHTFDGGYVIAGDTESFGEGEKDFWLLKTNPGGLIITE